MLIGILQAYFFTNPCLYGFQVQEALMEKSAALPLDFTIYTLLFVCLLRRRENVFYCFCENTCTTTLGFPMCILIKRINQNGSIDPDAMI